MGSRARLAGFHRDEEGEPLAGASVFVYQQHSLSAQISAAPTSATIYTHDSDHATLSAATTTLPLTTANDGSWGLFTADAHRVDIKIVTTGKEDTWFYGQDISKNPSAIITVQDEGTPLTQRATHNYVGSAVSVTDDAANARTNVTITGGAVGTDAIWDAAGDLAVGTGADTAAKLPKGTALQVLRVNSGATALEWAAPAFVGARVFKSASESLTNNVLTVLAFDSETFDTNTIHDNATNNTRLTLNKVGYWQVRGFVTFTDNATGHRRADIRKNGTTTITTKYGIAGSASPGTYDLDVSAVVQATVATDYVELQARQVSGGALNTNGGDQTVTVFECVYLGA